MEHASVRVRAWGVRFCGTVPGSCRAPPASQLNENLKALEVVPRLTPDVLAKIEDIVQTKP